MKVVFLGTNGWYDSPTGNTISVFIETSEHNILLDAGNGLFKADRYIYTDKPVSLFISHTHLDHIIGLHLLNKFEFKQGLRIYGQPGIEAALQTIFRAPYSLPFANLPYPVNIAEIDGFYANSAFSVQTAAMRHSVPTIGFRFSIEDKIITYCPDTEYCDNAVKLAKGTDLLIAECAFRAGEESEFWPHLNPETAARIAFEANARQLALIHFDAFRYPTIDSRRLAEAKARTICPNTIATTDEMVFKL
ncbi:MAG TPA: ribonuclease Z [Desulfitobacteriaceae bacterium]|nr:ribonuclease Z [Desulfitobacteriaceae bacterium]